MKRLLFFFIFLAVVACGPAEGTPTPVNTEANTPAPSENGYPPPAPTSTSAAYPAPGEATGVPLTLNKPIQAGAESVSGVGPPGLTVYIMNITFMGDQMGTAVVNDDGTFTVPVAPIEPGIRIGLTADVTTIGLTEEDIQPGDGQIGVPQVGYFYDSYVITQN